MSSIGALREAYTRLADLFASVEHPEDSEAIEVFLADGKKRESFYNLLCAFGKALNIVLNAEQAYSALPKEERKHYQDAFVFYSKCAAALRSVTVTPSITGSMNL